jgi:AraC-like DNA-binding protein
LKLYIKNMVCVRCETLVKSELEKLGFAYHSVKSGEIEIKDELTEGEKDRLNHVLQKAGLEVLDDKKSVLVEKIKTAIIELVHYTDDRIKINLSDHLKEKLNYDSAYMARLFAEVKGTTIEHFFIAQRIERAKELLIYDDMSLNEIADKLNYSSASHLCNQFKKTTGLTPTYFRQLKNQSSSN